MRPRTVIMTALSVVAVLVACGGDSVEGAAKPDSAGFEAGDGGGGGGGPGGGGPGEPRAPGTVPFVDFDVNQSFQLDVDLPSAVAE